MPSIKQESTAEAIARAFTSNGRNEEQAMLTAGYSKTYARSGLGHRIYSDIRVKAAIARIDEEARVKHDITVDDVQQMYVDGYEVAKKQRNSTGMATNTTGIARLHGMLTDNVNDNREGLTINVQSPDKALDGPKLVKEA